MIKDFKNKGFALLYALLLSGAVLTVGVILMNIVTKQLIFSSLNRESESTYYYLANSGRECLLNYASVGQGIFYEISVNDATGDESISFFSSPVEINCSLAFSSDNPTGTIILTTSNSTDDYPQYVVEGVEIDDNGVERKLDLSVTFNRDCLLGSCEGSNLIDKSIALLKADGYSGDSGSRIVKRSAPSVIRPF